MRRVREQEKALAIACGEFIAAKLVELGKLGNSALTAEYWQRMSYPANDVFESVKQALEKSTIGKDEAEAKDKDKDNATTSFESTVVEGLQSMAVQLDSDGKVISKRAFHHKTVPWGRWLDKQLLTHDAAIFVESVFRSSMLAIQKRAIDMPLARVLSVSGKSSTVQATTHLKPGELMIPLYFQRHN